MAQSIIKRNKTSQRATYTVSCETFSTAGNVYYGDINLNEQADFPPVDPNNVDVFPIGARASGKVYPAVCQCSLASGAWVLRVSNVESSNAVYTQVMYYY